MDIMSVLDKQGVNPAMSAFAKPSRQSAERAEAVRLGKSGETGQELEKKVRGVAEEFVSVFMNQITKSMRATVQENPAMHGDNGEKFFQDLLDTEYSKSMAKGSGYGLTDLIYESMMASYRVQQLPPSETGNAQVAAEDMNQTRDMANELAAEAVV